MKRSVVFISALPLAVLLLLLNARAAQPQQQPSSVVSSPEEVIVYVVGNVMKPQALSFKAPPTVTQVIAIAGGLRREAKRDRVYIIRTNGKDSSEATIIKVDLKAIKKRRAPDMPLQTYDIVQVGGGHSMPVRGVLQQKPPRVID